MVDDMSTTRSGIEKHFPHRSPGQVKALQHSVMTGWIAGDLTGAGLWSFIAPACKSVSSTVVTGTRS
jgi:hypothetical protein